MTISNHHHEFDRLEGRFGFVTFHRCEVADADTRRTASTRRVGNQANRTRLYRLPV